MIDRLRLIRSWLSGTRIHKRGKGHKIIITGASLIQTKVEIFGQNCSLIIAPGARLWDCSITLSGNGAVLEIGADCALRQARLACEDTGSRLSLGAKTTMTGPTLVSHEGRVVSIGTDCMISQDVMVRNSDSHSIFDEANLRINPAADILIEDHVWLGVGTQVLKGSRIGSGTIVGARSMVHGSLPARCIAFGTPATPRRHGVTWDRSRKTD